MKKITVFILILAALPVLAQKTVAPPPSTVSSSKTDETKNSSDFYQEAYDFYQDENYDKALQKINLAIKQDKRNLDFYDLKCYILIKLKRNKEIIETSTQAINLNPNDAKFYEIRGNTYYFDFEPEKALQDYRKMISLDQSNDRYYNNYLKLLNEKRLDQEMIDLYPIFAKALPQIKENPDNKFLHDVYFYFSLPFERAKNYEKAKALLTEAITQKNTGSMYYNNRGLIYQETGDLKLALRDLDKAIEIKSDEPSYYENRFSIYFQAKDYENARKDLLKILALGNNDPYIYANLGNTYQMQGKSKEAVENYEIALIKDPKNTSVITNAAYGYFELDNTTKAKSYFEKALALDPKEIDILIGLAVIYNEKKDKDQQTKILSRIAQETSYKPSKNLLKELMKAHYIYTEKFQKAWVKLF